MAAADVPGAVMVEPLVIIGNGMAAARLVEELTARAPDRYAITVVGAEPRLAYNRILLSSALAQGIAPSALELKPAAWWQQRGVTLLLGCAARAVDVRSATVTLRAGMRLGFGRLVFACGSRASPLPVPGADLPGVLRFRDLDDVAAIHRGTYRGARVVVIGGGLLGLEAAHGLATAGAQITVVHVMDCLMERQLDAGAAALLTRALKRCGMTVLTRASTARIVGRRCVESVELANGKRLDADLVIVATGVSPNVELAIKAGLSVNRGIVVDDHLGTSAAGIYAIGDCAEHRGHNYGLVEPAYDQARVLAQRLAGEDAHYEGSLVAAHLKVSGIHLFSAGDHTGAAGTEPIVLSDPAQGIYKKMVIIDDRLVGAVLFGDVADGVWYLDLIRRGLSITAFRNDLAFGRALAMPSAA